MELLNCPGTVVSVNLSYLFQSSGDISSNMGKLLSGDRELSSAGRHIIDGSGILTIKRVESIDRGDYICQAENSLGKIQRSVTVVLSGTQNQ